MVHLAKVLAIKELAVWSTSDGVCYQCQSMLHSTPVHFHFVLGSCIQLWPSTFHSLTAVYVLREQMCMYIVKTISYPDLLNVYNKSCLRDNPVMSGIMHTEAF